MYHFDSKMALAKSIKIYMINLIAGGSYCFASERAK